VKGRAWFALVLVSLLLVAIPLSQAWAGGGGRFHGGHPRVFIGSSFWWGPPYPYYYPYYYPYPYTVYAPAPAPVIVEQPVYTQQQPAAPEAYWYYCESAKAYYPSAPTCAEAWIKVPPRSE
jgi:hypothetical protein